MTALAASALALLASKTVRAQSWIPPHDRPWLGELVAIDRTGETLWPYQSEDIAGDGPTFEAPERSLDARSAYAGTDATRFWTRVYFSGEAVDASATVFVFIDADRSPATGGSAAATDLDPKLTTDPTNGGYEYVIGIRGNGTITNIWRWNTAPNQWASIAFNPQEAVAEVGEDRDPLSHSLINQHGYVQARVDFDLFDGVPFGASCAADLFYRSVNGAAMPIGDLDIGPRVACRAPDADSDGIPDLVIPSGGCTDSDQCPFDGVCIGGSCRFARPCREDDDCAGDEACLPEGRCSVEPGGTCSTPSDCSGGRVCVGGTCRPCTLGGGECGAGAVCGPDGRCTGGTEGGAGGAEVVAGVPIRPGDEVRGGACTCALPGSTSGPAGALSLAGLAASALLLVARRNKKTPSSKAE